MVAASATATGTTTRKKRTPPPRDPVTNKFLKTGQTLPPMVPGPEPDPNAAAYVERMATAETPPDMGVETPPVPSYAVEVSIRNPFRVWTAGPLMPQERIVTPGGRLKVGPNYAYHLTSPEQVAWAKQALGKRFWPDTVPEDEPDQRCETCGWTCRNYQAMNVHLNEAHGRPQYGS